jgi:hypothetical protein
MRAIKDVLLLALEAGQQKRYGQSAQLLATCLSMDDLPALISELGNTDGDQPLVDMSALASSSTDELVPLDSILAMGHMVQETVEASDNVVDLSTFEQFEIYATDTDSLVDEIVIVSAIGPISIK